MACMLPVCAARRRGRQKARVATADCLNRFVQAISNGLDVTGHINVTLAEGLGPDVAQRLTIRRKEKALHDDVSLKRQFFSCLDDIDLDTIETRGLLCIDHSAALKRLQGTAAMVMPEAWDSILSPEDSVFLRHGFLSTLEEAGCVSLANGWQPRFLLAWNSSGELVGAVPLYLRLGQHGEFCEDWSLPDRPHLFVGVPFTPHSGRRLVAAAWLGDAKRKKVERLLLQALVELVQLSNLSINVAFSAEEEGKRFKKAGFIQRCAWQAWWTNRKPVPYSNFGDFQSSLKPKKARNIERQHNSVMSTKGLQLETIDGAAGDRDLVSPKLMAEVWRCCYYSTQVRYGNTPDLNERFFRLLAERFGHHILLVLARNGDRLVGGSLSFSNSQSICGRYWGYPQEAERVEHLHFECCYHQLIKHAIARGCHRIEPGNGGDDIYRVQRDRGFEPDLTPSYHLMPDPQLHMKYSEKLPPNELPSWASSSKSAYSS